MSGDTKLVGTILCVYVCVGDNFKYILESEKSILFQQVSQCGQSSQHSKRWEEQHPSHYLLNQYLPDYVKYQPLKGTVWLKI